MKVSQVRGSLTLISVRRHRLEMPGRFLRVLLLPEEPVAARPGQLEARGPGECSGMGHTLGPGGEQKIAVLRQKAREKAKSEYRCPARSRLRAASHAGSSFPRSPVRSQA
jgi:hypothetical protein